MDNPIDGFGTYLMRNGETIVLNLHTGNWSEGGWLAGEHSLYIYSDRKNGNLVFPDSGIESPYDIVEKIGEQYYYNY